MKEAPDSPKTYSTILSSMVSSTVLTIQKISVEIRYVQRGWGSSPAASCPPTSQHLCLAKRCWIAWCVARFRSTIRRARTPVPNAGPGANVAQNAGVVISIESLRASAATIQNDHVQRAVLSAIDMAQGDLDKVKANIENWYNGTMDRVSGWYRRRTQTILFFIGLGAAAALNVDAITIAKRLNSDK